jgi:beta-phosphoglucomutase
VPIAAVVFDFDGVLADTERLHLRAFQDVLALHGRTLDDALYFERYLGYSDRDMFLKLARETSWTLDEPAVDALLASKADRYRHHLAAGDALYASAGACVRCLADRYLLGIASGSMRAEIADILTAGRLRDPFRVIVGADDVTIGKPAPEPYLKAAALLGVDPRSAVAIEDSHWGLESARAAGMRTIAITTTYPASALGAADLVVRSLDEISPDVIDRL